MGWLSYSAARAVSGLARQPSRTAPRHRPQGALPMIKELTTQRPHPIVLDPWGDLSIATLRRGLLTRGTITPDSAAGGHEQVTLLAVLDDGTFVVADAIRTTLHPTVRVAA